MGHLVLIHSVARPTVRKDGFTAPDLIALACWRQSPGHGYRRVEIEAGRDGDGPETSGYALVYGPASDWASYGLARCARGVVIWHCGTGTDLGHHDTMQRALESLPPTRSVATGSVRQARAGCGGMMQPAGGRPRFQLVSPA